jgi:hypothetical protein
MNGTRVAAVLAATMAATLVPAWTPAEPAEAAAKKCRKGSVLIKTGHKKRCVKLRVRPPRPKAADRGKLALDFLLASKWPALRDRRGRRVPSLAKRLRRTGHGAAPGLRRTFTKGLALVAARRRAPAATAATRGEPRARAAQDGDGVTGVSNGNTIGFDGEIPAGQITIFVEFRTGLNSDRIEGEDCPTGAGRLEGRKRSQTSISIRFVGPGRRLISGYSATLAEENTYRGQTADDAKIDTLTIDHEGSVRTTFTGAGQAPLSLRMVTTRRAQVNMRSGTYTAGERRLDVNVRLTGVPADVAGVLEAEVARRLQGETDREFAEVVYTAMFQYRQMENRFNQDSNRCVAMRFDPHPDQRRYLLGERGRFKAWLEPTLDRGTRPNGIYQRKNQLNVEGTPTSATGTGPQFGFRVTMPSNPAWVQYRATSKAGVAVGTHDVLTQSGPFYKVVGLAYTDHLTSSGLPPAGGCSFSATQDNSTTLASSGQPVDGGLTPEPGGSMTGFLRGHGTLDKHTLFSGCQTTDGIHYSPCTLAGNETEPLVVDVEIVLPPADTPAQITWHQRPLTLGDVVVPPMSQCVAHGANGPLPAPVTTSAPRAQFLDPGAHTIALDAPATVPALDGFQTIGSTAHYALTFERVNEDGSPYTP